MNDTISSICCKNLTVGFDRQPVACLSDFQLAQGEILVLAGPNGAGKSTALKTLARQLSPLAGSIHIDTADLTKLTSRQFARRVAYVPQRLDLTQDLSVVEYVSLGRYSHQSWWSWESNQGDRTAVEEALAVTGTLSVRSKPLGSLSGGERQRAMIATALAQKTQFLLADEPTAHLDFKHQLELVSLLKDLKQKGLGILLVLHDLNLIARLADRIILLQKNKDGPSTTAASGTASEVLRPETLSLVYEVEVAIHTDPASGLTIYTPTSCRL